MPVVVRAIRASARAGNFSPAACSAWATRCASSACTPGQTTRISVVDTPRAAGSRSRATATSWRTSRTTPNMLTSLDPLRGPARRRAWRRSARRSPAAPRRCACPASPAAWRPRARPTAPRRTTGRRARPPCARHRRAVSIAASSGTGMISSSTSRLSTGGTKPAPIPWILCGPGARPESTAELAGSTATTRQSGLRSLSTSPAPVIVPPVPTPATNTSTWPSSASQISGPVVRRWISGFAGLENWSGQEHVVAGRHRPGGVDRLGHAAHRLGDLDPRAVEPQQALALAAHALREREDEVVALRGADERERDAGVAARRLDDRRPPRLDAPFGLGRLDHRDADPVLDAAAGVERLELAEQPDPLGGQPRELHHRRSPDLVGDVR